MPVVESNLSKEETNDYRKLLSEEGIVSGNVKFLDMDLFVAFEEDSKIKMVTKELLKDLSDIPCILKYFFKELNKSNYHATMRELGAMRITNGYMYKTLTFVAAIYDEEMSKPKLHLVSLSCVESIKSYYGTVRKAI